VDIFLFSLQKVKFQSSEFETMDNLLNCLQLLLLARHTNFFIIYKSPKNYYDSRFYRLCIHVL